MLQNSDLYTKHFHTTLPHHIFLMGQSGVGKTTLIQSIVKSFPSGTVVGGFTTSFDIQSDKEKTLFLSPFTHNSSFEKKAVMQWHSGNITVFEDVFESYGVTALKNAQRSNLIIMDELGRFEKNCNHFKSEVFNCLDGDIPVLGVIRNLDYASWLDGVKNHPNVMVLNVTEENRNEIEKEIRHILFNKFEE